MAIVDANATVVVNIFALEVVVEDINTEGEAKGLKTAPRDAPRQKLVGLDPTVSAAPCRKGSSDPYLVS